jgi:RNA polymerase sigma factor (sigma-70 family)
MNLPTSRSTAKAGTPGIADWVRHNVERYEASLIRYTSGLTGDLESARDVVQETFLKLCRQKPGKVGDPPGPWLYRVCRNHALDLYRKRVRHPENPIDEAFDLSGEESRPDADAEQADQRELVQALLKELTAQQREVVRLKFMEGLSYKEIAKVTGLRVSNVGVHLHNAIKRLREKLNEEGATGTWKEDLSL